MNGIQPVVDPMTIAAEQGLPWVLTIELTTACNWRCQHCYIPHHNDMGLPPERIIQIIDEAREMDFFEVLVTGGEISLRDDTLSVIQHARKLGMRVSLLSNASRLTEADAAALAAVGVEEFGLTIFSMDPAIHDSITGIWGSQTVALRGAQLLKDAGVPVRINSPLMKINWEGRNEVVEFARENGFIYLNSGLLQPKYDGDTSNLKLQLTADQLAVHACENQMDFQARRKEDGAGPDYSCMTLRASLAVAANGDVRHCGSHPQILGNVTQDSLRSIWESRDARTLRDDVWEAPAQCASCGAAEYCDRCPALSLSLTGDAHARVEGVCIQARAKASSGSQQR